ncbi:MAG: hypothetical protein A2W35_21225 [Chloroflexi bacterium RBG_16_57_11]|nr:MAG: hypothetical protein A2W35_21225 [Chloroflexi bacterium RBG_16_57_11]
MERIYANTVVGRKNIGFGIALFILLGVAVGVPLTIDLFGGSILSQEQYQTWKVIHAYGVFLAFINYFFGLCIDRLSLTRSQKEISSWSFLLAGIIGGLVRMILVLTSTFNEFGIYASLSESACFIVGTLIFVSGQVKDRSALEPKQAASVVYPHAK